ncbi:hypothetical protein [Marinifilum sp.]|uniref:hypothetical protein n=1 Tax=Marinifilum sp. TaxID=2033137 RepID=UPI003BA90A80
MEYLSHQEEITDIFNNIRSFSYEEKHNLLDTVKFNRLTRKKGYVLLDERIELKGTIVNKNNKIRAINEKLEKLSWLNHLNEECLMLLNDIIALARDLRNILIKQFVTLNPAIKKGILKNEIKDFIYSIDELKETYEDLESVFFFLPKMQEFK